MIIKNQHQLLKLKLIKTKIYEKNDTFTNLKIEDIEYRLKKGLQIMHKYHVKNKKILFINNSLTIGTKIKKLLKNTKHIFMSYYLWLNGGITNTQLFSKDPTKRKTSYNKTSQFKNKSDLIVILDKHINTHVIEENYKTRTPILFLGSDLNIFDNKSSYKIPGNFVLAKKKIISSFFLTLLKTIFKKSKQIKNKNFSQDLTNNKKKFKK